MNKENKQIIAVATNFVISILNYGELNAESVAELFEIKNGNKKVLLDHLKAIDSIISNAIKLLGDVEDE